MFRFANPEYLYLLAVIPLLILVYTFAGRRRKKRLARFGNPELVATLMPLSATWRPRLKQLLFLTALAALIVAVARPQLGSKLREQKSHGIELMFVVDVSNSMLSNDFTPNRLEHTKYSIKRLFEGMKQERAGLIAFAGKAAVQLPITSDFRLASTFVDRLSPAVIPEQGTSVGRAIDLALLSFSRDSKASKVIILITDGEDHEQRAINAAKRAEKQGVKIFAVGIGTPEGAPININGELLKDADGKMVVSKLNEAMLSELASISKGGYVHATKENIGLSEVITAINKLEKGEIAMIKFAEYDELYKYVVALALALLLIEFYILARHSRVLGRFNIFRK